MAIFAIHYTYPDDVTEMLTIRPEHREWLSGLPGLLVAGMYQDGIDEVSEGEPTDQEPAQRRAHRLLGRFAGGRRRRRSTRTPTGSAGYILRRVVRQWDPPLGPWVADPTNSPG